MTYYRNQRMEAFKRAMFAGLGDPSTIGQARESGNARREAPSMLELPEQWQAQLVTGAPVH